MIVQKYELLLLETVGRNTCVSSQKKVVGKIKDFI